MNPTKLKKSPRGALLLDMPPALKGVYDRSPEPVKAKLCVLYHGSSLYKKEQLVRYEERVDALDALKQIQSTNAKFILDREQGWNPTRDEILENQRSVENEAELREELKRLNEQPLPFFSMDSVWEYLQNNSNTLWRHRAATWTGSVSVQALEKLREKIDGYKVEKKRILGADLTGREGDIKLDAEIKRIARSHKPKIEKVLRYQMGQHGYRQGAPSWTSNPRGEIQASEVLAIMFDVIGPTVLANYRSKLRQATNSETAISAKEKTERVAKIDIELLEAERLEEALIMRLLEDGFPVVRRTNAQLKAVLEIEAGGKRATPEAGKSRGSLQVATADDPDLVVEGDDDDFG